MCEVWLAGVILVPITVTPVRPLRPSYPGTPQTSLRAQSLFPVSHLLFSFLCLAPVLLAISAPGCELLETRELLVILCPTQGQLAEKECLVHSC